MFDLDRFKRAQDDDRHTGIASALRELRAGRKTGHWIWYVFPQLSGLGRSSIAIRYALVDLDEAAAYLRDPVLLERLVSATAAVRTHVAPERGQPEDLQRLMGSDVDTLKLVSCMTLFREVASRMRAQDRRPELSVLVGHADAILVAAGNRGYQPCAYTLAELARPSAR